MAFGGGTPAISLQLSAFRAHSVCPLGAPQARAFWPGAANKSSQSRRSFLRSSVSATQPRQLRGVTGAIAPHGGSLIAGSEKRGARANATDAAVQLDPNQTSLLQPGCQAYYRSALTTTNCSPSGVQLMPRCLRSSSCPATSVGGSSVVGIDLEQLRSFRLRTPDATSPADRRAGARQNRPTVPCRTNALSSRSPTRPHRPAPLLQSRRAWRL